MSGDGEQTRDFVFVEDVVDAFIIAVLAAGDGRRIDAGTGAGTSVNALFLLLAELTGHPRAPLHAPPRPGELQHIALRAERAERQLGWRPRTGLDEDRAATLDRLRA